MTENNLYARALALYNLTPEQTTLVPSHEGGRNQVYALKVGNQSYVLRFSKLGDRSKEDYLAEILNGYTSETPLSQDLLNQLPLFIDMVLIENLVDEFECCARENELPDNDDIEEIADCLIQHIPYAGFC